MPMVKVLLREDESNALSVLAEQGQRDLGAQAVYYLSDTSLNARAFCSPTPTPSLSQRRKQRNDDDARLGRSRRSRGTRQMLQGEFFYLG
jgi:hypothetical protein